MRSEVTFVVEPADSEASLALQQAFFADIASRYPGWTPEASQNVEASEMSPPLGAWLVVYLAGRPIGCGGLQRLDAETAEVRRIYLDEQARGHGVGRGLLAQLEAHAVRFGYKRVRLTTGDEQPEALKLFKSAGYEEIPAFTEGLFTRHWMEKRLSRTEEGGGN